MRLQSSIQPVFVQLTNTLALLTNDQYTHPSRVLSNATIGGHTRHIIEMFTCLQEGYHSGVVNYEKRKRDHAIETKKDLACALLKNIYEALDRENKPLVLEGTYNHDSNDLLKFDTSYYREVAFNLEHTIHHMALIKIGIRDISDIEVPEGFGVASSTIKFRAACAQ